MDYKLIAVDMDGTLLNSDNQITDATVAAVKAAQNIGVVFTLSTGRPLQGVKRYIDQLNINCPVITYNGAVVVHSKSGKVLFSQDMDNDDAKLVYQQAKMRNIMFVVWASGKLYVSEFGEKADFYSRMTNTKAELIDNFDNLLAQGITKILWYHDADILESWIPQLNNIGLKNTTITKSRAYFLEFFSDKASKAVAMEKLGQYYSIDRTQMIAIGDQTNDLPMIEYAGLGIAMGNAVEAVKAAADYITDDNNNDGVAKAIEKFVLK